MDEAPNCPTLHSKEGMAVRCLPLQPADASVAEGIVVNDEKQPWLQGLVRKEKHPKVRTGCLTCKKRRLKCDEAKPSCQRCLKSGRSCAGYHLPQTWVFDVVDPQPRGSLQDEELLQHFLRHGSRTFTGYSVTVMQFCSTLAPQLGHADPAVRSALLSTAARTQSVIYRWDSQHPRHDAEASRSKALLYYNKAIRHLTQSQTAAAPGVFLVCGLLFAATESWPHRDMAPVLHILSAYKLLLHGPIEALPSDLREGVLPFLVFVGRIALAFGDEIPVDLCRQMRRFTWFQNPPTPVPSSFEELSDAIECTETLLKYILALEDDDPDFTSTALPIATRYSAQLLQALQTTRTLEHAPMQYYDRALLMHHRVLQLMLDTRSAPDESIFDLHFVDFAFILGECKQVIEVSQKLLQRENKIFRPTLGALSPLFFVATRCRRRDLRLQAIRLLHSLRCRERTWNSCVAAMLARFVMRTEERNVETTNYSTIPEEDRIRLDQVWFDQDSETIVVSYKCAPFHENSTLHQRTLTWKVKGALDHGFECVSMSKKVLRANGYTGTLLVTPPIACQCGNDDYDEIFNVKQTFDPGVMKT